MQTAENSDELSAYQRLILNKIITEMHAAGPNNIYQLVQHAISQKSILPSINTLVMETCYVLKEYLLARKMVTEETEMTSYVFTEAGLLLKTCGTIEKFEKREMWKRKLSILSWIFKRNDKHFTSKKLKRQTLTEYE